jgi:uncharacterized protein (TIGR00255 family)
MTGYGRGEAAGPFGAIVAEIRSVNNRYLDLQARLPRELAALELRVRKAVQERFSRGRFDIFITRSVAGQSLSYRLNAEAAGQYIAALKELKDRFSLAGDPDLALVALNRDIIETAQATDDAEAVRPVLEQAVQQALSALDAMRRTEGQALVEDIRERLAAVSGLVETVRQRSPLTVESAKRRLEDALARLGAAPVDAGRLAQEVAFIAERADVTEELTRLESHLRQFRGLIDDRASEVVGRKLDFLLQEMGREINTTASKSADAEISQAAVGIKAELEKIREQVQNIE